MVQGKDKMTWGERVGGMGDSQGKATKKRKRGGGSCEKKERKRRGMHVRGLKNNIYL